MKITKFFALMCATVAMSFAACEPIPTEPTDEPGTENPEQKPGDEPGDEPGNTDMGLVLSVESTMVLNGDIVTFTVTDQGVDVTNEKETVIYNYADMSEIKGNTFTTDATGRYSFFATYDSNSSNTVTITVVEGNYPAAPEDTDAKNTKFNHRILVVDHTGINCPNCPLMTDNLIAFHKTEWADNISEVTCHAGSYAAGDPANSPAANVVDQFHSPGGYPDLSINFYSGNVGNYTTTYFLQVMSETCKNLVKTTGADAGIAINAVDSGNNSVLATISVKSAVEQEYKVTAWLLENNIYSKNQAGASKPEHYIYNHALRSIADPYSKSDLAGVSIGTIGVGQTTTTGLELPISNTKWLKENLEILVIASAKNKAGRWEVVNTAVCPLNSSVGFEYLQ